MVYKPHTYMYILSLQNEGVSIAPLSALSEDYSNHLGESLKKSNDHTPQVML